MMRQGKTRTTDKEEQRFLLFSKALPYLQLGQSALNAVSKKIGITTDGLQYLIETHDTLKEVMDQKGLKLPNHD